MYAQETPETIQALFSSIAGGYDRANAVLSFGLFKAWNRVLIDALSGEQLLDLCAGTGEIALAYLKKHTQAQAVLLDFCPEMLLVAEQKGKTLKERFQTLVADAQSIPLASDSIDCVSIAYGIRNVQEPKRCFEEVYRVLKPGGHFALLELTRPTHSFLRAGHRLYLNFLLPVLGKLITQNKEAYAYLSRSIGSFVSPVLLEQTLEETGFVKKERRSLMGGIATLIVMRKCN